MCSFSENKTGTQDQILMTLMRLLTHSKLKEVRKKILSIMKGDPEFSHVCLFFIGKRLRDKDDEIRRLTFKKL